MNSETRSVLTIGNFDGVHKGHKAVIRTLVQEGRSRHLPSFVLTFDPHPIQVLYPDREFLKIFDRDDQIKQMEKLGVENLILEPFTKELSRLTAEQFLRKIFHVLNPTLVIVGYDFSFGANRSGSIGQLMDFAKAWGFELMIIPPQKLEGEVISSSRIRKAVLSGDMELANQLLERPFYLRGQVEHGFKKGRTINIPTANLKVKSQILPPTGVYITETYIQNRAYCSVTNIGFNPTVENDGSLKIETHILNFDGDLYDEKIQVAFLKRLRDEIKFSTLDELKNQIKLDILETEKYFSKR